MAAPSDTVAVYHLAARLHPDAQQLSASATLTLAAPPKLLRLELAPQAVIEGVMLGGHAAGYTFQAGVLTITPPATPARRPLELTVRYRARFDDPPPPETVGIEDPSYGVNATITGNGTYLSAGTAWFPQLPGIRGRHRIAVTAPEGIIAVTAGRLVETATHDRLTVTVWENDVPLEGLALAAGRLEVARDELDGIQLLTFLSTENAALAPGYLAAMRRHLAFYRDLLGPYPYPKFAVVENFLPTGYGMPSWTLLGKSVVRLPFLLDTSLPHEIVHSWWGNAVEVDYTGGNWAEGLTTYLADYLVKERNNPAEALEYRRKILRDYAALVTPANDFPLKTFSGRMARYQQAVGYGKGAMVFHMLRLEIGDEVFRSGLRRMAAEGTGRTLGWGDLEQIFTAVSGRELGWFFRQWVEVKGAPQLTLEEVRRSRTPAGWVVSGTVVQQGTPYYRLDLPLRLTTAGSGTAIGQIVRLDGRRTPFSITSIEQPVALQGDPESALFRRLGPGERPATVNDLFSPQKPLVIVAAGRQELQGAVRDLLKGLHWEQADVVAEDRLDRLPPDRDLLFLGWPRHTGLHPRLPAGMKLDPASAGSWQLPGEPQGGDTLFTVVSGRQATGANVALLLSRSPEAVRAIAAKIPHYGRFSLLLFENGRNIRKTTWDPETSPLLFSFDKDGPR